MELDLWKDRLRELKERGGSDSSLESEELASILRAGVRKARRAVRRALGWELSAIALIYVALAALVLLFDRPLASFQIKIIVLSGLAAVPVVLLFVRYLAVDRPDLGRPVSDVLRDSARRLDRVIRVYRWAGLALAAALSAALWLDAGFRSLPPGWKWGISAFILAMAALSIPYLRAVYGRRLDELKSLARDAEGSSGPPAGTLRS